MSKNTVQELVKGFCKLYKGGDKNPYRPFDLQGEEWAKEYIKFQVWDAEYSVCQNYYWWLDTWQRNYFEPGLSKADTVEEVYKLAVRDKLSKMNQAKEYNWIQMYFDL